MVSVERKRLPADERRAQILAAAASVFGSRGFEATRMDDVADKAGVAKALLYKHFPSKDALFEALLDEQARLFASELRSLLAAGAGEQPQQLLRRGLALWLGQLSDERPVHFSDPGGHDAYEAARNRVREIVVDAIRSVEPTVRQDAAWLLAAALQGAAESAGLVWAERPGSLDRSQALDILTAFCWGGLSGLRELLGPQR